MNTAIRNAICTAIVTEVGADTAIIGGVLAARGKAPWALVGIAAGVAVAGMAVLLKSVPAIQEGLAELAAEGECQDGPACGCR